MAKIKKTINSLQFIDCCLIGFRVLTTEEILRSRAEHDMSHKNHTKALELLEYIHTPSGREVSGQTLWTIDYGAPCDKNLSEPGGP